MEHYANDGFGPQYAIRLSDLRDWHVIAVHCMACHHRGTLYPAHLRRRWPDDTLIIHLQRRFRCTGCRRRAATSWQVRRLGRG